MDRDPSTCEELTNFDFFHRNKMNNRARVIAFHLPQFHPTPENDQWWGKGLHGMDERRTRSLCSFSHYQPHIPADLGFYDLRLPEARLGPS